VTNSIWVHHDRLADFTSMLREPGDLWRLERLWQAAAYWRQPVARTFRVMGWCSWGQLC